MIADDVTIDGEGEVFIPHPHLVNLYGCTIGEGTTIGPFVEIQKGAVVGRDCTISSHSFICEGVTIGDGVFIGHGVIFCNERWPMANRPIKWELHQEQRVWVGDGAVLGSGARILPGVTIGEGAVIGCGAIVTKGVGPHTVSRLVLQIHEYPLAVVEE